MFFSYANLQCQNNYAFFNFSHSKKKSYILTIVYYGRQVSKDAILNLPVKSPSTSEEAMPYGVYISPSGKGAGYLPSPYRFYEDASEAI